METTFEDLEDSGCIKMTEDSVEALMLGSIASQYYLSYMTVSMFGSNIGPDTTLEVSDDVASAFILFNLEMQNVLSFKFHSFPRFFCTSSLVLLNTMSSL